MKLNICNSLLEKKDHNDFLLQKNWYRNSAVTPNSNALLGPKIYFCVG